MRWLSIFTEERGDFGGRKDREKEAKLQEDIARQREEAENEANRIRAQLVPGSVEAQQFEQLVSEVLSAPASSTGPKFDLSRIQTEGNQLLSSQQQRIASGGAATPLEARTQQAFEGLRDVSQFTPEEQSVFSSLRGFDLGEGQVPTGTIFNNLIARAQDPNAFFESTFQPQLDLLQDQVKARAAQRGILGSGLELEDLGRTGAELAIREGQARSDFDQRQLANFFGLFDLGQQLRGREIGVEEALTNLQLGRESNLTSLLNANRNTANQDMLGLLSTRTGRAQDLRDVASALREAERQQREQFVGNTVGNTLSTFGGKAGEAIGGAVSGSFGGSSNPFVQAPKSPTDVSSLVAAGQTPGAGVPGQSTAAPQTLSRQPQQDETLKQLLSALAMAGA